MQMIQRPSHATAIAAATAILVLSGCATPKSILDQQEAIKKETRVTSLGIPQRGMPVTPTTVGTAAAADAIAAAAQAPKVSRRATRAWVGARTVDVQGDEILPPIFNESFDLAFDDVAEGSRVSVGVMAERLSRLSGVPVRVKADVYQGVLPPQGLPAAPASATAPAAGGPLPTPMPTPIPAGTPGQAKVAGVPLAATVPTPAAATYRQPLTDVSSIEMRWKGTLSSFLDHVTARLNLSWTYRDGVVVIERFQTETFELAAFGGTMDYKLSLSGTNTGSAGGASGSQGSASASLDVSESGKLEALQGLKSAIESMARPAGGSVVLLESSGRFMVTAPRDVMSRVRELVKAEDAALQRQAQVQIDVYSVITSDADEKGVDWNLVYQSVANSWGATVASPTTLAGTVAGATGFNILAPTAGSSSGTAGRFGGSSVVLNLLNQVGDSAQHRPVSLIALNRQWARKTALKTDGYVSETTPATASSAGSGAPGLKTGSVTTGDKFLVQPAILDNGNILLKFGVSLTELLGLFDVTAGSGETLQKVQTPVTSGTDDQGTVRLKPGEAMVVTGLSRRLSTNDRRTMADGVSEVFGGSRKATVKREEFMVVIRAFQI
jgi:type IVB pilus formation R64 PilN family outer membrane protein